MENQSAVVKFKAAAQEQLPGMIVDIRFADPTRRASHMGPDVVSKESKLLFQKLKELTGNSKPIEEIGHREWLMLLPPDSLPALATVIDDFKQEQEVELGWKCKGYKGMESKSRVETVKTIISRALICSYATVTNEGEIEKAIQELIDHSYKAPPNSPTAIETIERESLGGWQCVAEYPLESPKCPYCGGANFDWEDGDSNVYSGSGTCEGCGVGIGLEGVEIFESAQG